MRTALLVEILQIVGGLVLVFFAGRRLLRLTKRPGGMLDKKGHPGDREVGSDE